MKNRVVMTESAALYEEAASGATALVLAVVLDAAIAICSLSNVQPGVSTENLA
jgi:hypothetical protein